MDVNYTYCGDHFVTYTNIKSLRCIPETNTMLYVSNISKKKKKEPFFGAESNYLQKGIYGILSYSFSALVTYS